MFFIIIFRLVRIIFNLKNFVLSVSQNTFAELWRRERISAWATRILYIWNIESPKVRWKLRLVPCRGASGANGNRNPCHLIFDQKYIYIYTQDPGSTRGELFVFAMRAIWSVSEFWVMCVRACVCGCIVRPTKFAVGKSCDKEGGNCVPRILPLALSTRADNSYGSHQGSIV